MWGDERSRHEFLRQLRQPATATASAAPSFNQQPPYYGPQPYGQPAPQSNLFGAYTQDIPNYLTHAVLVTFFCCVPAGIVAIVYAAQVNGKKQIGDIAGAAAASSKAQTWCWVAFGLGLIAIILNVIITVAGNVK